MASNLRLGRSYPSLRPPASVFIFPIFSCHYADEGTRQLVTPSCCWRLQCGPSTNAGEGVIIGAALPDVPASASMWPQHKCWGRALQQRDDRARRGAAQRVASMWPQHKCWGRSESNMRDADLTGALQCGPSTNAGEGLAHAPAHISMTGRLQCGPSTNAGEGRPRRARRPWRTSFNVAPAQMLGKDPLHVAIAHVSASASMWPQHKCWGRVTACARPLPAVGIASMWPQHKCWGRLGAQGAEAAGAGRCFNVAPAQMLGKGCGLEGEGGLCSDRFNVAPAQMLGKVRSSSPRTSPD
jgi:hypothetical protein